MSMRSMEVRSFFLSLRPFVGAARVDCRLGVGSPWGAGTLAGPTGSRQPTLLELDLAKAQGEAFDQILSRVSFD